jgi:hypothetical protein
MNPNPIAAVLRSLQRAHLDAIESAGHPSSKPHREALRAFQKHSVSISVAVAALEEEREKAWTPVTRALPDDELLVLIAVNDDDVWTGYRLADTWRYVDGFPIENERVTHWMPMPVLPIRTAA